MAQVARARAPHARPRTIVGGAGPVLESREVEIGRGLKLEVIQGGQGPALVWLHGLTPSAADDPMLQALAARFAVTAPVLPGQKDLAELDRLPSLHDLVLAYDSALGALDVGQAIVAGHGFGGMLAAELAAHCPGRVKALALVSPLGLWSDAYPVEDMFALSPPELDELVWRGAAHRPPPTEAATIEDEIERRIALAHALGGIAYYTWPIPERGLAGRPYRIAAPALLLFPEADALVPAAYARDFAQGLADNRIHPLGGSHMAPYEAPAELARIIGEFAASAG